jgi:hypothetical protein
VGDPTGQVRLVGPLLLQELLVPRGPRSPCPGEPPRRAPRGQQFDLAGEEQRRDLDYNIDVVLASKPRARCGSGLTSAAARARSRRAWRSAA